MEKIKFIHFRRRDKNYELLATGGLTMAAMIGEDNKVFRLSLAYCSNKDNYNKKIGRAITTGRIFDINNPHTAQVPKQEQVQFKELQELMWKAMPDKLVE